MKKILKKVMLVLTVVMILSTSLIRVDAAVVKIQEFNDALNNSQTFTSLNELSGKKISSKVNENDKTIDFYLDEEKFLSFKYTDEYIEYENRDTVITKENCTEDVPTIFMVVGSVDAMIKLSGHENETFNEEADDTETLTYEKYGILLETEHFSFEETNESGSSTLSGDYLRYFKLSLDTDKIDAYVKKYGTSSTGDSNKEILDSLTPTIRGDKTTANSITIYPNAILDNISLDTEVKCHIYRSTTEDGEFEKITETPINCINSDGYTDSNLSANTTYYYKTMIDGGSKYSGVLTITTLSSSSNNNVEDNPKTGVSFPIVMFLLIIVGGIVYNVCSKNKSPMSQL